MFVATGSCIFGLNCLLAGRSVALRARTFHRHVMRCVSGTSNSFAFLDSTAFWRGGLMHGPILTFDRHQVANEHHSEAKIEFAEFLVFLCVVVDDGFWFWKDTIKKLLHCDIWKWCLLGCMQFYMYICRYARWILVCGSVLVWLVFGKLFTICVLFIVSLLMKDGHCGCCLCFICSCWRCK